LPTRFTIGIGVFSFECIGKVNFAITFLKVLLVKGFDFLNMHFDVEGNAFGKRNGAVVLSLAIAHNDMTVGKVNILDTQSKTFHESESRPKQQLSHKFGSAIHFANDCDGFGFRQHSGKAFRFFGADDIGGKFDILYQHVSVEKEDGAEGLIPPAPTAGAVWVEAATFRSVAR